MARAQDLQTIFSLPNCQIMKVQIRKNCSKTRIHSSRMRTVRSSGRLSGGGGSVHAETPAHPSPQEQNLPGPGTPPPGPDPTPWDQAPPRDQTPPRTRHPPGPDPLLGPGTPPPPPPPDRHIPPPPVDRHTPVKTSLRTVIKLRHQSTEQAQKM